MSVFTRDLDEAENSDVERFLSKIGESGEVWMVVTASDQHGDHHQPPGPERQHCPVLAEALQWDSAGECHPWPEHSPHQGFRHGPRAERRDQRHLPPLCSGRSSQLVSTLLCSQRTTGLLTSTPVILPAKLETTSFTKRLITVKEYRERNKEESKRKET